MNINCLSKTQRLFKSSGDNKTTTSLMFYGKCFMFYGWCFMGKKSPSNMQLQSYSLSVQFSRSVVSDSLRPHGLQHTRPPCASPTSGVYPNSCPLSWWYHPTISSCDIPFSSCLQSFPASGSFQMSQLFASGGQSIGVSASNISPSNEHSGLISFRMDWLDLLAVRRLSRVFSNTTVQKHQFFCAQLSL